MSEFHQLPWKYQLVALASFLIAIVLSALFLKFFVADQSVKQFLLLWWFVGGAFAPTNGKTPEWEFWIWSPLLGLGRFISGILVRLFVK